MLFYRVMRKLSWLLLKIFFRYKVTGASASPRKAARGGRQPRELLGPLRRGVALMKRPPATFLAAPWVFETPLVGGFVRRVGAVAAYGDGQEVTALRESVRVLQKGGTVALFPQGGIGRDTVAGGAVFMAVKAQAPLLPCA